MTKALNKSKIDYQFKSLGLPFMSSSILIKENRDYTKLPFSEKYYDLKDKTTKKLTGLGKTSIPKKNFQTSSSSNALILSSSSPSSSSSSLSAPKAIFSKISKSIVSGIEDEEAEGSGFMQGLEAIQGLKSNDLAGTLSITFTNGKITSGKVENCKLIDCGWLKKNQLSLLQSIFATYALNRNIRLYDLLGFHLYNLLDAVKKTLPLSVREKFETEIIKEFNYLYSILRISLSVTNYSEDGIGGLIKNHNLKDLHKDYFVKKRKLLLISIL